MKKQNKRTKQKLSKWILPTMPISWLRKLDSDSLNKYAKMYGIKSPKGKPPYTDKELVRELRKFIPSKKGKKQLLKIIKELVDYKPKSKKTNIMESLSTLNNKLNILY